MMQIIERGWLSANSIVFHDTDYTTVVDTGYCTHVPQTLALVQQALQGRSLNRIVNTHLHSDHCGGNAALLARYGCEVLIPPGEAAAVATWDEAALSYHATGQLCPRFAYTGILQAGSNLQLGGQSWQVLAAPGHDPASIVLFCPADGTLISADALWENGFGVIFPELVGEPGFDDVLATLDMIASLNAKRVVPGHGSPFTDVPAALKRAYTRIHSFIQAPDKHRWHGVKVLLMYWMMDVRQVTYTVLEAHFAKASYFHQLAQGLGVSHAQLLQQALLELVQKGQLRHAEGVYSLV